MYFIGYVSIVGLYCSQTQKMYALEIRPYLTQNSCMAQYLCWKQIRNTKKLEEQNSTLNRTSLFCGDPNNEATLFKKSQANNMQEQSA